MRLHTDNGYIHAGRKGREAIDLSKAAKVLTERGHRLSTAIAQGDLSTPTGVRALARQAGLLAIDTTEARAKGLIL